MIKKGITLFTLIAYMTTMAGCAYKNVIIDKNDLFENSTSIESKNDFIKDNNQTIVLDDINYENLESIDGLIDNNSFDDSSVELESIENKKLDDDKKEIVYPKYSLLDDEIKNALVDFGYKVPYHEDIEKTIENYLDKHNIDVSKLFVYDKGIQKGFIFTKSEIENHDDIIEKYSSLLIPKKTWLQTEEFKITTGKGGFGTKQMMGDGKSPVGIFYGVDLNSDMKYSPAFGYGRVIKTNSWYINPNYPNDFEVNYSIMSHNTNHTELLGTLIKKGTGSGGCLRVEDIEHIVNEATNQSRMVIMVFNSKEKELTYDLDYDFVYKLNEVSLDHFLKNGADIKGYVSGPYWNIIRFSKDEIESIFEQINIDGLNKNISFPYK
jgi:hypothetical protein